MADVAAQLFSGERCYNVGARSGYTGGQDQVLGFMLWAYVSNLNDEQAPVKAINSFRL